VDGKEISCDIFPASGKETTMQLKLLLRWTICWFPPATIQVDLGGNKQNCDDSAAPDVAVDLDASSARNPSMFAA
jgi:hypothetical protein